MTVSSEGRSAGPSAPSLGRPAPSPCPAGSLARLAAPRCDGRVDREPGGPKSRGPPPATHGRESPAPGRPVARISSVSRTPGSRMDVSRPPCTGRWCPRARLRGRGQGRARCLSLPCIPAESPLRPPVPCWTLGNWSGSCSASSSTHREPGARPPQGAPDPPGVLQVSDLCQMRGGRVSLPHPDGGTESAR